MNPPHPPGLLAQPTWAAPPSPLRRDAVEWGYTDAGAIVLETLALGVIVVAFLGQASALALVGLLMLLGARALRSWIVFDPATRTGWRARGFRWFAVGPRLPYDALRPALRVDHLTTRIMRQGREVNRVRSATYTVTLGAAEGRFTTAKQSVAEACCVWAQLATGGTVTPPQLRAAIDDHDRRAAQRALFTAGTALAAFATLMTYALDPVYARTVGPDGAAVMTLAVAPMLLAAVVRAWRIGRLPRCVPGLAPSVKGWFAAGAVAAAIAAAIGVSAHRVDQRRVAHDESERRVARALAAMPDPGAQGAAPGLTRAPLVRVLPTRVEGALTEAEALRRLGAVGFTARSVPPWGLAGLRLWSVSADNGAGRGASAERFAPPGDELTLDRSARLMVAVSGGDPTARAALAALLQARLGGYGVVATDLRLAEVLEDAGYTARGLRAAGVSTVRARGVRRPMQFELVALQVSYQPALAIDADGGLLVVRSRSGDPREELPWTRFVLATLAGAPRS